jgi:general stress protein CsbA
MGVDAISGLKIPLITFFYFLNDEMDRLTAFFPCVFLALLVRNIIGATANRLQTVIALSLYVMSMGLIYMAGGSNYGVDLRISVAHKTFAVRREESPWFSGLLMIVHKFQIPLLAGSILADFFSDRWAAGIESVSITLSYRVHGLILHVLNLKFAGAALVHAYFMYRQAANIVDDSYFTVTLWFAGFTAPVLTAVLLQMLSKLLSKYCRRYEPVQNFEVNVSQRRSQDIKHEIEMLNSTIPTPQ